MTIARASSAFVLCAVWMASASASANLRAPGEVVATPSGALLPAAREVGDRVRVLRKTLKLASSRRRGACGTG